MGEVALRYQWVEAYFCYGNKQVHKTIRQLQRLSVQSFDDTRYGGVHTGHVCPNCAHHDRQSAIRVWRYRTSEQGIDVVHVEKNFLNDTKFAL